MVLVDTNILLNAVNADSSDHESCATALTLLVNEAENWALPWPVIYEFLRVATHGRVCPSPLSFEQALGYVLDWSASESCSVICESGQHLQTLGGCRDQVGRLAGNIIHDLHIALLMQEHGITEILTLDRDYNTFPWVVIRSPGEN